MQKHLTIPGKGGSSRRRTNKATEELIDAATQLVSDNYDPEKPAVATALRLATGDIVVGLQLNWGADNLICSEAIALGRAVSQCRSPNIKTVVVVRSFANGKIDIVSPCGMCREMFRDYAPSAKLILPDAARSYSPEH